MLLTTLALLACTKTTEDSGDSADYDLLSFYADADGDGFGDAASPTEACEAPSGYVEDATDCDDANAEVFPGADELCNGADDDCDAGTDEDGRVAFTDGSGVTTDVTSSASGSWTLSDDGELVFCDGTYEVNLILEADVAISSQGGDATAVILDGAEAGSVVAIETDELTVSLEDLTLTGGTGTMDLEYVEL